MSYFAFTHPDLHRQELKVAVVFLHPSVSFEAWLCGRNKNAQNRWFELLQAGGTSSHSLSPSARKGDYLLRTVLTVQPDFDRTDELARLLEAGVTKFNTEMCRITAASPETDSR